MEAKSSFINPGIPVKSSIPLVEKRFGQGFGFEKQISNDRTEKEVLIELSKRSLNKTSRLPDNIYGHISASPLSQALDALSSIADRIELFQKKAAETNSSTKLLSDELSELASEFRRITQSSIFNPSHTATEDTPLQFSDSIVKSVMKSGNQDRIETLSNGLNALREIGLEENWSNSDLPESIRELINQIRGAMNPGRQIDLTSQTGEENSDTVRISGPQVKFIDTGKTEGLTLSMLGFSNSDLIKAAAAHVDINSVNVLVLTFNSPEPESEIEKKEREENSETIEIENP